MASPFGTPSQFQPQSLTSVLVVEPTLGLDVGHSPLNIGEGATPNSDNWIMRDGRLEPRSTLSRLGTGALVADVGGALTGGTPANTVNDARYLLVGAYGNDVANSAHWFALGPGESTWHDIAVTGLQSANGDYWDYTQIFSDVDNENVVVAGVTSRGTTLWKWIVGNVASAASATPIAGSPGARFVAAFNDYLLAANVQDPTDGLCAQRVSWSDRGSASSWTGGVSGFQDLLGARGAITRILPLERRIIVFFEDEIWEGSPVDFPFTFNFSPLDTTLGCPYSWTVAVTPKGIVFMARNFQLYLLPKEGGAAQPVGQPIHRRLRDTIVQPTKSFGAYDGVNDHYQFYYSSGGSRNFANRAAFLHFETGAWAPQSFHTTQLVLTRAFTAPVGLSHASTWDDFTNLQPSITWGDMVESWDDLMGVGNERQVALVLSPITVLQYSATQKFDSMETSSSTVGVSRYAYWEGKPMGANSPPVQKAITRVDVEYVAPSASSVTVRTSANQGATYGTGVGISLMTASNVTSMPAYVYQPARYPMFRVETSDQTGLELHRFHVTMRVGGR